MQVDKYVGIKHISTHRRNDFYIIYDKRKLLSQCSGSQIMQIIRIVHGPQGLQRQHDDVLDLRPGGGKLGGVVGHFGRA